MRTLISSIDAFGIQPSLLIHSNRKHKSFFGGLLSIILIILLLLSLYHFGKELILKESPSVNLSSEFIHEHPKQINFFNHFEFLISLLNDQYLPVINEKIYYPQAFLYKIYINETGQKHSIRFEVNVDTCDKVFTKEHKLSQYVNQFELSQYYCISHNQNDYIKENLYINDYWGNEGFQMIQFKLNECVNSTERQCASQEEIDNFLYFPQLSIYSFEEFVQTQKYKDPISHGYKNYFYYVSNRFVLKITQYLRNVKMISDDGWIFHNKEELYSFKHDHMYSYINSDKKSSIFCSFSIQLTNEEDGYRRDYMKIVDLVGKIGGIYKALFVFFVIISHLYNENSMYEGLFNHFFEVTPDKGLYSFESNLSINNETKVEMNNESLIRKEKRKIKLSFCEKFLFLALCKRINKKKKNYLTMIFYNGKEKICSYLETSNYLIKIHHVDMIRKIISENENIEHVEYLSTPLLYFDENKDRFTILVPEQSIKTDNKNELSLYNCKET